MWDAVAIHERRAVNVGFFRDGAIEIAPMPVHPGLVNVPSLPDPTASATAQTFSHSRRELALPVADHLVTEHDAADQEDLR
jgi:hypothetical protein